MTSDVGVAEGGSRASSAALRCGST